VVLFFKSFSSRLDNLIWDKLNKRAPDMFGVLCGGEGVVKVEICRLPCILEGYCEVVDGAVHLSYTHTEPSACKQPSRGQTELVSAALICSILFQLVQFVVQIGCSYDLGE